MIDILLIAGDTFAGLLDGWCGPCRVHDMGHWVDSAVVDGIPLVGGDGQPGLFYGDGPEDVALNLRHREAIHRVVDVLGEGEECIICCGSGWVEPPPSPTTCGCDECGGAQHVRGTGYTRQPVNVEHFRPSPNNGLPDWQCAGLIACSVARIAAGLGPVHGVMQPWRRWLDRSMRECWRGRVLHLDQASCNVNDTFGWRVNQGKWQPETGEEGKAKADAAALDAGYALLDGDVLRLPFPHGAVEYRKEMFDAE